MIGYYGRRWPERNQGAVMLIGSIARSITTLGLIMISMTAAAFCDRWRYAIQRKLDPAVREQDYAGNKWRRLSLRDPCG